MRYDAKVSTLEDREILDKLTMDELHGILIAYEMRTWARKTIKKGNNLQSIKRNKEP
jgi:hypothetical protein